ncbi:MAG: hypothetical protein ABJB78_01490 [Betaproteobacteria bacterium]
MSFYEGRPRRAGHMDVHETPAVTERASTPAPVADTVDWLEHRTARPADQVLPIAQRWSASLPIGLRPRALLALYPRVANLIALQWNDSLARAAYFDELLIDRRGRRVGFPAAVHAEILRLRDHSFASGLR